jgi:hypothetical protein
MGCMPGQLNSDSYARQPRRMQLAGTNGRGRMIFIFVSRQCRLLPVL